MSLTHFSQALLLHTVLLLLRCSMQPPDTLPFAPPSHKHPSGADLASKSGLALLQTVSLYRELLPLLDTSQDAIWSNLFSCFTPMSMHAIALLARPERADAAAHAHATLSLMSVWSTSYGNARMLKRGSRAIDWQSGGCTHLAATTIALMRSFVSSQDCVQAVSQCSEENSSDSAPGDAAFSQHRGNFVLSILGSCAEVFAYLFKHALAFLPLAAPSPAQEFLLDEIIDDWRASSVGREGSQEFWDVAKDWEAQMINSLRDSMAVQRCATAYESLLLAVPIFLQFAETCISLLKHESLGLNVAYAQSMYVMRGMLCPCTPSHPVAPSFKSHYTAPLLLRTVLSLCSALSDGLSLLDLCMKSCLVSRTTLVAGGHPAPFRSQCTLLLASGSAWSTVIHKSRITQRIVSSLRDVELWLPPPLSSSKCSVAAAAVAAEIANAFDDQKSCIISTLQLLHSCLIQSLQSFDQLEDGTDFSVVSQLDVAAKCLGATYLKKNSFRDWASVRYPKMVNFIFQPHSMKATTEQRTIDVLFATQAGFVCALHADAVLASVLQAASVSSICATDHIVSLSELHGCSTGISSSATVREPRILMSDIVERLLRAANPASGTNALRSIVIDMYQHVACSLTNDAARSLCN
jgi:hypothetical protein